MADNYTMFSIEVTKLTKEEREFFLNERRRDDSDDEDPFQFHGVEIDVEADNAAAYLFSMDYGNPDYAADVLQRFFAKYRPTESIVFSVAYHCSKPRPGEFGGVAFFVNATTIEFLNAEDELRTRHGL